MKRVMMAMVVLAAAQGASGAYTYTVGPTDNVNKLYLYNSESALVQGTVGSMGLWDSSSVITKPGSYVHDAGAAGTSHLEMTGGTVAESLSLAGDATLTFTGGFVNVLIIGSNGQVDLSGGGIHVLYGGTTSPIVNVICKDHSYNSATRILTGTWADNTTFQIDIDNVAPQYDILGRMHFSVVPEPVSLMLFGVGAALAHMRRSRL